jgi:uncharacterized protein YchJ
MKSFNKILALGLLFGYTGISLPTHTKHRGYSVQVRTEPKIHRNEKCPCGSGIKHKKCCLKH